MILSSIPIYFVDFFGSILMIVFSFLCLRLVLRLRRRDKSNLIWTYLFWICIGFTCFAVSRSAGHILKNLLILSGHSALWKSIRPFSGSINTFSFIVVGSITLFFERIWKIYQTVLKDRQAVKQAHQELLFLNQNLEELVQKRTNDLAVSEHKYRQIFEVSKDMILVTQRSGQILNLNPSGCQLLGLNPRVNPLTESRIQQFLADPDDWKTIIDAIHQDGAISSVELDIRVAKGIRKRTLFSGSIAKGSGGDEDTILFLVKDIEQRRLMEEQLAQADKLASIGELSSGVAHEINNPLGIILGYTQMLLRSEDKASERAADLKTIEKHVRNCKTIVEDLLNFARTSPPKMEKTDVHRIIDEVIDFVQHHSGLKKIDIEKSYTPDLAPLVVDAKRIKQVIMNLIMNARHAIGDSGAIRIATQRNPTVGKVYISIKDTGYGIEKKNLSRIFDPFFTTKPTGEGTGLGLSVSYGIVKSHGGDISVKSDPGQGSEFTVTLPLSK